MKFARAFTAVAAMALALTATVPTARAIDDEPPGPVTNSWIAAFLYSLAVPEANTPGANDWSCVPSAEHPRPVVLVHGTYENRYNNWAWMGPELADAGYCVYALSYGDDESGLAGLPPAVKGTGDIAASAGELAAFVDEVLAATGASQVDIVGHSQGGMMPRQYLRFEGGANADDPAQNKVRGLISLAGSHHGTTLHGLFTLADTVGLLSGVEVAAGTAAVQQAAGSDFLETLNAGGDTMPGIDYTVIATMFDEVVTPYQSTFLQAGPDATVHNVTLQDGCALDLSDHISIVTSTRALGYVLNALDPDDATPPPCALHLPVL